MIDKKTPATPPPYLLGVLRSLYRWRKPILIVTAVGAVLAIIASLLMPVSYKSTTSFLAVNPDMNSIDGTFGNQTGRIGVYGNRDDIDRLMAVAESDELVDYMVEAFSLYRIYNIDSTKRQAPLAVNSEFFSNYEVVKTPRTVIELSVLDEDPRRAARMAKAAREFINDMSVGLTSASQIRTVESLRGEIENREVTLNALNDTLQKMRSRSGIYDTEAQSEALSTLTSEVTGELAVTEARIGAYRKQRTQLARDSIAKLEVAMAGLRQSRMTLDSQLNDLNMNIGPLSTLEEERTRLSGIISYDRLRLKQYETVLRNDRRALEVVTEARTPVVKAKPQRSLVVLSGMLFSFVAAIIGILIIESSRHLRLVASIEARITSPTRMPRTPGPLTPPPAELTAYYGYAGFTLVVMVVALFTENYFLLGLPLVLWVLAQSLIDFRPLFYLLLAMIPLSTNLQLPGGFGTDVPTEPLAIGLTGLFLLHLARHWHEYESKRFLHPIALLMYAHVGWIIFTSFFSSIPVVSLKFSAAKLWYVGAYFMVPLLLIRTPDRLRLALHCILWPLLFVGVQTLVRHSFYGFSFADQHRTMFPFMSEHVSYAACLAMFVPWIVYLRWWRGHVGKPTWWLSWVIIPLWLLAVYFTFTRAAFVALIMAGGVFYIVRWKLLVPALAVAVAGAIAFSVLIVEDNRYLDFAPNYDTTVSHGDFGNLISATYKMEDISTMERVYRWVAAGHMVPYEPVLGWGPGTFLKNYKGFTVSSFRTYVSDNEDGSGLHSYYLLTLVEQGFPGLLLYLCYVFGALIAAARAYRKQQNPVARNAIMAALLALIIVDAFNLINDQMENDKVGAQYMVNLAIIISMSFWKGEASISSAPGQ